MSGSGLHSVQDRVEKEHKRMTLLGAYPVRAIADGEAADSAQIEKLTIAVLANAEQLVKALASRPKRPFATVSGASPGAAPNVQIRPVPPTIQGLRAIDPQFETAGSRYGVSGFTMAARE